MHRWLILLLFACGTAHAMPPTAENDVSSVASESRFRERIEEVGNRLGQASQTVRHTASDLVVTAMGFLGVPYRRGGNTAETGFDCSGFVRAIYQQTVGLVLPRRADEQAAATQRIDRKDLQPGDLVFFNTMKRTFSHVGIYVGDNKFIHSPKPGAQVRVESMGANYWSRRFDGARRVQTVAIAPAAGELPASASAGTAH